MLQNIRNYIKENNLFTNPAFTLSIIILLGFIILGAFFKSSMNNISVLTNAQGITVSGTSERFVTPLYS
jgi:hypothetical protein